VWGWEPGVLGLLELTGANWAGGGWGERELGVTGAGAVTCWVTALGGLTWGTGTGGVGLAVWGWNWWGG